MKTVEEYSKEWSNNPEIPFEDIIKKVQKEAYNQALIDRDNYAIEFAKWVESLSPSSRVSVWSKNGSMSGLFDMDMEQLLCKYKSKQKQNENRTDNKHTR